MPSYKPKVQVLLTPKYHAKFKALCERERRSDSVMGAIMIESYIDEYESENGPILPNEETDNLTATELLNNSHEIIKKAPFGQRLKTSVELGAKIGKKYVEETYGTNTNERKDVQ